MNNFTRFTFLLTLLLAGLLASPQVDAQNAWWTWVNGSPTPNAAPNWGQKGVTSPSNTPGGRTNVPGWADASGNFWIFGGLTPTLGLFDDLWEYNPNSAEWTFVSGTPNTGINAGIYGTEYQPSTTNQPGGRMAEAAWADKSGNFWVFGGNGYDINGNNNLLNDLWEYNPANGTWTWMGGNTIINQSGVYGEQSFPAPANQPGAREECSGWSDALGNVWIFGGYGYDAAGNAGPLNDLWKFNTTTHQWTWISGGSAANRQGNYGIRKVPGLTNVPGARSGQNVVVDALGNFWLFGGATSASSFVAPPNNINGIFNDLWEFNPTTGFWTWVAGSNQPNQIGIYGTQGTYAPNIAPGGRFQGAFQIDINGNFWVYGGYGLDADPDGWAELSDYWVYNPNVDRWAFINGPSIGAGPTPGNSVSGQQYVPAANNLPSGRQGFASWMDRFNNIWIFGGGTGAPWQFGSDLWMIPTINVPILALKDVTLQAVAQGQGNQLNWQTVGELDMASFGVERSTDGANFTSIGSVTAIGYGSNSYTYDDAVLPPGVSTFYYRLKLVNDDRTFSWSSTVAVTDNAIGNGPTLYPNPAHDAATLQLGKNSNLLNTPARLFDVSGKLVREYIITNQQQTIDLTNVPQGVYFLQLSQGITLRLAKN